MAGRFRYFSDAPFMSWDYYNTYPTREEAKQWVGSIKRQGGKARIVKTAKGYVVWARSGGVFYIGD